MQLSVLSVAVASCDMFVSERNERERERERERDREERDRESEKIFFV